jgi:hypothetical protein
MGIYDDVEAHLSKIIYLLALAPLTLAACRHGQRPLVLPPHDNAVWFVPSTGCPSEFDTTARSLPPTRVTDTLERPRPDDPYQTWVWLARRVPGGFAAIQHVHGAKATLLRLRDTTRKAEAFAAIDSLWPLAVRNPNWPTAPYPPDSIVAVPVKWDAAELYDWKEYFVRHLIQRGGGRVNGWGADLFRDRVIITVDSMHGIRPLRAVLEELHVPCHLVAMQVIGPVSLAPAFTRP